MCKTLERIVKATVVPQHVVVIIQLFQHERSILDTLLKLSRVKFIYVDRKNKASIFLKKARFRLVLQKSFSIYASPAYALNEAGHP